MNVEQMKTAIRIRPDRGILEWFPLGIGKSEGIKQKRKEKKKNRKRNKSATINRRKNKYTKITREM